VNETQTDKLDNLLRLARQLYNAALQQCRDAWKYQNKSLNYYDQANQLTELPKRKISRVQNRQPVNIVAEECKDLPCSAGWLGIAGEDVTHWMCINVMVDHQN
jgi:hypothetical protein